ncbi:hypothetical protein AU461_23095 [Vibrio parahaemolyticus]|uniref:hypothetical protein n=1 Tax=Vibrio parahaemolyticus TaxID=670 RepID=UPI000789B473|nr:hypothetical protein [Vibrio parahaemolyticus]KYO58406.1 hypothetical protein AU461_23095 [Vibrio parahaemolyticus]KYX47729.1 hypothetical protein AU389_01995 [Vibrio parahaemolyticus]
MNLESALNAWLTELTGLDAYWLERPEDADTAVVYRCITPGRIDGNLRKTGIKSDVYSITLYHHSADAGKQLADQIADTLDGFCGVLSAYPVQLVSLNGGFDQPLTGETGKRLYQFNRDFVINH